MKYKNVKTGFTLAEIIISMTIIGIIAAITIPALLVSTSEKTMKTQQKALLARVSQAISQIEDLRKFEKSSGAGTNIEDKGSAMNFVINGLSKVYRVTKICSESDLYTSCAFPDVVTTQDGSTFNLSSANKLVSYINNDSAASATVFNNLNTSVAGFKTANGESFAVFYNPRCYGNNTNGFYGGNAAAAMCLNFIYDLNGKDSAPNEVGKDIGFITVFFPKDPDIVAPIAYSEDATAAAGETIENYADTAILCKKQDRSLIIPTSKEGMSIILNKRLTNSNDGNYIVSGAGSTANYSVSSSNLSATAAANWPNSALLRCVYNN